MAAVVVIPFRPGPYRTPAFDWNMTRWRSLGWPVEWADSGHEPFNRSASINQAIREAEAKYGQRDTIVVADADTAIGPDLSEITAAIRRRSHTWHVAYRERAYYPLTEAATEKLLVTDPTLPLSVPADITMGPITSYSGCLVMHREAFETVGGFDERFRGFGCEDFAFMYAMDTLYRPHTRMGGFAVHLYHPHIEAERFDQPYFRANKALHDRYERVRGDKAAMLELVEERGE